MVKFFDKLPWIIKLIFALPGLDFLWGIYRLVKGIKTGKLLNIVIGIVWVLAGWAILWIVDLVCVIVYGKPTVFA